jgi:hypothetical protein
MSLFITYLFLVVVCLSPGPGSVIIISGQRQIVDAQILDGGDDQQCASIEEREKGRNEIANSVVAAMIAILPYPQL